MYSVAHIGKFLFKRKRNKNVYTQYSNRVDIGNASIYDNQKFYDHRGAIFCYNSLGQKQNWFTQLIQTRCTDLSTY